MFSKQNSNGNGERKLYMLCPSCDGKGKFEFDGVIHECECEPIRVIEYAYTVNRVDEFFYGFAGYEMVSGVMESANKMMEELKGSSDE